MTKIAITHPGKIGDLLYVLPVARELYKQYNSKIDIYTDELYKAAIPLLKAQDCIADVITIATSDMPIVTISTGWKLPIPEDKYDKVFHLGFRSFPLIPLPEYIAKLAGFPREVGKNIYYDTPCELHPVAKELKDYIVVCSTWMYYFKLYVDFIKKSTLPVIEVGIPREATGYGHNLTGLNMLEMAKIIEYSKGFLGYTSSSLCIANGFNIKKVITYNYSAGSLYLFPNAVQSELSLYLQNPKVEDILNWFGL